ADHLDDPAQNLRLGARFLAALLREFGDPRVALAAYNAGPKRARQWWSGRRTDDLEAWVELIPYDETRHFVKRVVFSWNEYRRIYGGPYLHGLRRARRTGRHPPRGPLHDRLRPRRAIRAGRVRVRARVRGGGLARTRYGDRPASRGPRGGAGPEGRRPIACRGAPLQRGAGHRRLRGGRDGAGHLRGGAPHRGHARGRSPRAARGQHRFAAPGAAA